MFPILCVCVCVGMGGGLHRISHIFRMHNSLLCMYVSYVYDYDILGQETVLGIFL